jgi:hypothetical protein
LEYLEGKGIMDVMDGYSYAFKEGYTGGAFYSSIGEIFIEKTMETVVISSLAKDFKSGVRDYVNTTRDFKFGFYFGAAQAAWNTVKGVAVLGSFSIPGSN